MSDPTPSYHIEIQQGDDRPIRFPVTSDDDGAALNVSGWPVRAQLRPTLRGPVIQEWKSINGTAVAEDNSVLLLTDGSRTWEWTHGVFDVELTHPGGETTIEATGTLHLRRVVTR